MVMARYIYPTLQIAKICADTKWIKCTVACPHGKSKHMSEKVSMKMKRGSRDA